jgi:hypothetical protein
MDRLPNEQQQTPSSDQKAENKNSEALIDLLSNEYLIDNITDEQLERIRRTNINMIRIQMGADINTMRKMMRKQNKIWYDKYLMTACVSATLIGCQIFIIALLWKMM